MVGIEDVEDVVGEGGWVTEGEELFVDFLKFRFSEIAGGTVFEEACFFPIALDVSQAPGRGEGGGRRGYMCLCTIAGALSCRSVWLFGGRTALVGRACFD